MCEKVCALICIRADRASDRIARASHTYDARTYARIYTRRHAMFALLCQMILYCTPLCFTATIVDAR